MFRSNSAVREGNRPKTESYETATRRDEILFFHVETGRPGRVLPCKLSCAVCRAPIADEGRRMFLAFGPLFGFGYPHSVPRAFEPSCHIFYGARVIDVNDGKPKYFEHKGASHLWTERAE